MTCRPTIAMRSLPRTPGEPCGDRLACLPLTQSDGAHHLLAVIDGLGHGAPAAQAADSALDCLRSQPGLDLPRLFERLDEALQNTRGAAIGLARLNDSHLSYAAIGNTRLLRWREGNSTRLPSQYGIVGDGKAKRLQPLELELQARDVLVLFSDGLDEGLQLGRIPPIWLADPELLCTELISHWRNPDDDAGVLVAVLESG